MIPSTTPLSSSAASSDALAAFEVDDDALDDAVEREVRRSNDDGEDFRASTPTTVIVLRLAPRKPSTVAIAALINTAARATLPTAIMRNCVRCVRRQFVRAAGGGS